MVNKMITIYGVIEPYMIHRDMMYITFIMGKSAAKNLRVLLYRYIQVR